MTKTGLRAIAYGVAAVGFVSIVTRPNEMRARQDTDYLPVTDERLRDPEPGSWLMYRRTYNGWGYSPLDQITEQNVSDLTPVWVFPTGVFTEDHQSPPIVNGDTMFVTTSTHVIALNAKSGELRWRYARELPSKIRTPHPTNRGVGLYADMVYVGTLDAHVVALNATSGQVVWDRTIEDYRAGYYITMAPMVVDGKVMVGTSGGENGVRGFVIALDAMTGDEVWKTYTIPAPGEPGNETWPAEAWRTGGGPVWVTGTHDPELNLVYWGVGNGGPLMGDARPGDNLFTNSTIALDLDTGALRGHHQYHWNGSWDWDEVTPPLLIDIERGGRTIPSLVHVGRNGYLWWLEQEPDRISFIDASPYVYQNVFTSIDSQTGRPTYDAAHVPGTGTRVTFCPSVAGAKNWQPEAYNPKTGLLYIPATENLCSVMEGTQVVYTPGEPFAGANIDVFRVEGADHLTELQAWNVETGDMVWKRELEPRNGGSVLTTGGDLVFLGGQSDRFRAYSARSGDVLWEIRTNSGRAGVPTSYAVDGVQYIAVQTGAEPAPRERDGVPESQGAFGFPQDGVIWVFALDCQC